MIQTLIGDDLPGICGVAAALMEQDEWPNSLAETGYNALVNAIQLSVAQVAAGFQHATHAPTKEEIDAAIQTVKDNASKMVHDAIKGEMSGWQLIWYGTFGNNDDTIGTEVWTASHDDFAEDAFINFSQRWSGSNGDWEIFGSFTGVAPCPADAVAGLIGARGSGAQRQAAERALEAMREFRAKDYRSLPGLEAWWRAIQEAIPDLVRLAARDPGAREAIARLLAAVPAVLGAPDCPLAAEHFRDVTTVLNAVSKANPRLYRAFAHSGLARLADLQGENWKEAIRKLASARPRGRKR